MTESHRQRIVDAIANVVRKSRLQPGEFTVRHYANARHLHRRSAARELEALLAAGYLTRRPVNHKGNRCWAYRPNVDRKAKEQGDQGTGSAQDGERSAE
jgi:hypothetical protein